MGLTPILAQHGCFYIMTTTQIWKNDPAYVIMMQAPLFALGATRIIICSVCKQKFSPFHKAYLYYLLFIVNRYMLAYLPDMKPVDGALPGDFLPESWLALTIFIQVVYEYMSFVLGCIDQITSYLDIYCLRIKHKQE